MHATEPPPRAQRSVRAPAVLIALADADLRSVSSRVLEAAGYRVMTARHAGHALLACLTAGRIDVLLTDYQTPESSGPALTERLRRHNPDLRSVYVSNAGDAGRHDVLVTPTTADALLSRVTAAHPPCPS